MESSFQCAVQKDFSPAYVRKTTEFIIILHDIGSGTDEICCYKRLACH